MARHQRLYLKVALIGNAVFAIVVYVSTGEVW